MSVDRPNAPPLTVGSFYRPPGSPPEVLVDLVKSATHLKKRDKGCLYLAGDFNLPDINWTTKATKGNARDRQQCQQLLNFAHDLALDQMVMFPTRQQGSTKNTLDLVFTTHPDLITNTTVGPGLADHDIVITEANIRAKWNRTPKRKILLYSKANTDKISEDMSRFRTSFLSTGNPVRNAESMWSLIKNALSKTTSENIPTKTISGRFSAPWFGPHLKRLRRKVQRAYNRTKDGNDSGRYRSLRKKYHKECRAAHDIHVQETINPENGSDGNRNFWRYIKSLRRDSFGVPPLRTPSGMAHTPTDQAAALSSQFSSVFTEEGNTPLPHIFPSPHQDMPKIKITTPGVLKLLQNLKTKKAKGPDDISASILKMTAEHLAEPLAILFQQSLDEGKLPSDWCRANITPTFKKGNRSLPANYRPISLTNICCKMLEHIVCRQVLGHLDRHNILTDRQHGFRSRRSCESQLLITSHDLLNNLDRGIQTDAAILDFSKAFDKVPHHRLLAKLNYYGLRHSLLQWSRCFLTERTQRTVVNGVASEWAPVLSGVPQGTVLGPLFFLLYINDIPSCVTSEVRLFADDCLIYRQIQSMDDQAALQRDLNALDQWGSTWMMAFNTKKCHTMSFTKARKPRFSFEYSLAGDLLQSVASHPYLGLTFSRKLNWNDHIDHICARANQALGFIRRNLSKCPRTLKEMAYKTLVRPLLEYCSPVWNPHQSTRTNQIEMVQRRAARFVLRRYGRLDSPTEMLESLKWPSLHERRQDQSLTTVFKVVNNLTAIDKDSYFINQAGSTRRKHDQTFRRIQCATDAYRHSFFPGIIQHWNALPEHVVSAPSLETFKARLALTRSN